jgi:hypothetical protein
MVVGKARTFGREDAKDLQVHASLNLPVTVAFGQKGRAVLGGTVVEAFDMIYRLLNGWKGSSPPEPVIGSYAAPKQIGFTNSLGPFLSNSPSRRPGFAMDGAAVPDGPHAPIERRVRLVSSDEEVSECRQGQRIHARRNDDSPPTVFLPDTLEHGLDKIPDCEEVNEGCHLWFASTAWSTVPWHPRGLRDRAISPEQEDLRR